jgi:hypothetical protein
MTDAEKPENTPEGSPEEVSQAQPGPEDWPESSELGCAEISPQELSAYGITIRKLEWMIGGAGAVCAVAVIWPMGWAVAVGVLLGTVLGWLNFRWLAASVNAIGERIVNVKSRERGVSVVIRGVGRIFLIVLFAYVIFTYCVRGLAGFFAGLAMPVVALMCKAMYEFVANTRRSS